MEQLVLFVCSCLDQTASGAPRRSVSEVLILFAEGSSAADTATSHYAHADKTRGHNLGQAVENHLKPLQLIGSEMQDSSDGSKLFNNETERKKDKEHITNITKSVHSQE